MRYTEDARSNEILPEIEHNSLHVYVRWNFVEIESEVEEETTYSFKEYFMTDDEYEEVRIGRWSGEWTDKLREIQRSYLYDNADVKIMKYSTDAYDKDKYDAWVEYKRLVRATPSQQTYPAQVAYPPLPPE